MDCQFGPLAPTAIEEAMQLDPRPRWGGGGDNTLDALT